MSTARTQYSYNQQLTSARLVSTSNIAGSYLNGNLNNGLGATLTVASLTTIDSVTLAVDDRVLLVAQTNANENGIYVVNSVGTNAVLERAADFQNIEQIKEGQYIPISAGTANAGAMYVVVEPIPGHLGVDDLNFSPTSVPSGSTFLVASNNLSDVDSAATSATNLGLGTGDDVVFSSLTLDNDGLKLKDTNASNVLTISPGSNLTADRVFTLTTGDAARTLNISAADVTISAFAATILDDANAGALRTTLGAQAQSNIIAATTGNIGGAGAGPIDVTVAGLTASSIVVATIASSSNAVAVAKAVAGSGKFTVTFSADPGATCTLNYVAFVAAQ